MKQSYDLKENLGIVSARDMPLQMQDMKSKNAKIGSLADARNVRKREKVEDLPRSNDPTNFNLSWIL